jgi:hypothetical protein
VNEIYAVKLAGGPRENGLERAIEIGNEIEMSDKANTDPKDVFDNESRVATTLLQPS